MRAVLIDRDAACRQLLRRHLEQTLVHFEVVAESALGMEATDLCRQSAANLLLLDHCLFDISSADAIAAVRRELPAVRVLIAACHHTMGLSAAIEAGAHGCVMKAEPLEDLQTAIAVVSAGGSYFSPMTTEVAAPGGPTLTPRQRQILGLIATGSSTKQVAAQLNISFKTADHHRTRLMKKLDLHDLANLVRFAIRTGVTPV